MKNDLEMWALTKWKDKVQYDIGICQIKNWRRDTLDRDFWRQVINHFATDDVYIRMSVIS